MENIISKIRKNIIGTEFENKTFICGGFVRDKIMKRESKDIDIVVNIENGGIKLASFLHNQGITSNSPVLFERFGTAQIIIDGEQIELVETRKEFYESNSRKPKIKFGTIEDDINRRDFTINSMLMDICSDKIIDLKNGKKDITNQIIRTTSEPNLIFNEDPLRMLRAIRFSSQLGFIIEHNTLDSIHKNSHRMQIISKERIRDEFCKLLMGDNVRFAIRLLISTNLYKFILPELKLLDGLEQPKKHHTDDALGHTLDVINNSKNTIEHKVAALLHDIGKPFTKSISEETGNILFYGHDIESERISKRFLKEFKFSNEQIDLISLAVKLHMNWCNIISKRGLRKYIYKIGIEKLQFCLELALADVSSRNKKRELRILEMMDTIKEINEELKEGSFEFPFNGKDVIVHFNIREGKLVGEILEKCKTIFLNNIDLTKEEIFNLIEGDLN